MIGNVFRTGLVLLFLTGCGYSTTTLYPEDESVAVLVFKNRTLWRKLEENLTREVTRQIVERTPYRLQDPDRADLIVDGEISGYSQPVLSEDQLDRVVRSSAKYNITITIKNAKDGKVVREETRSFSADFSGRRGEAPVSARREAEHKIARWVTRLLEKSQW